MVTDIRMPPNFTDEGIAAARLIRKQYPGTGIVILSQYDEPEYAISLLSEGAAGYAYLLKDRVAEGDQLARAVREVSAGGSMLDPRIVNALTKPVTDSGSLSDSDERLLQMVAEGRPDEGDRGGHALHAGGRVGRRRAALPDAGAAGERRHAECAAAAPPAAPGDRRPRGAGREPQPHAARWAGAEAARAGRQARRDRAARR